MVKVLKVIFILAIAGASGYVFLFYQKVLPCQKPIAYNLGVFDKKFGISQADFLSVINKAEQIWETPLGKQLFVFDPAGDLKINLVYDYRQEATDKIKQMGLVIGDDKTSYGALKSKYKILQADYLNLKLVFESAAAAFHNRQDVYNKEVVYWNEAGGASKETFNRLNEEKVALQTEADRLNKIQNNLNTEVEKINALAVVLNRLVATLNLEAAQYNEINRQTADEFQQGVYKEGPNGREIDIYQFDNVDKLLRVLAHELGHALSLDHLENPKAIMYYLNEGLNESLTQDDLLALKAVCRIK